MFKTAHCPSVCVYLWVGARLHNQVATCPRPSMSVSHTFMWARRTYKPTRTHRAALFHCVGQPFCTLAHFFLRSISVTAGVKQIMLLSGPALRVRDPEAAWERNLCALIRMPPRISPNLNHSTLQSSDEQMWQCHKSWLVTSTNSSNKKPNNIRQLKQNKKLHYVDSKFLYQV